MNNDYGVKYNSENSADPPRKKSRIGKRQALCNRTFACLATYVKPDCGINVSKCAHRLFVFYLPRLWP